MNNLRTLIECVSVFALITVADNLWNAPLNAMIGVSNNANVLSHNGRLLQASMGLLSCLIIGLQLVLMFQRNQPLERHIFLFVIVTACVLIQNFSQVFCLENSDLTFAFRLFTSIHCLQFLGLRMHNVTRNQFPIKKIC